MDITERIRTCKDTRIKAAEAMAAILTESKKISETDFCNKVSKKLYVGENWNQGWYSPPPKGIAALFGTKNNSQRLAYDNLRKPEFWPQEKSIFSQNSIGYIYASPVNKHSGIIGDFGMSIYNGGDVEIKSHLVTCLNITEQVAEFAQVGMKLKEVYEFCQKLLDEKGLNSQRMLTYTDKARTNIGHTVPWSYEDPTAIEQQTISSDNFDKLKNLVSQKRIHLNDSETFRIPKTIAFTVEPRAESNTNPTLPMASFHSIVTFTEGKKEILTNFNPIFKIVGMDKFINSKY